MSSEDDDNSDRDHGPPDPHDDDDFGHGGGAPAQARPLDPLALFIQDLEELSSMNGPNISSAVDDLPLPQAGDVSGVFVQEAVAVSSFIIYDIRTDITYISYTIYVHSDSGCVHRRDSFCL
jgi:hypothetical protein